MGQNESQRRRFRTADKIFHSTSESQSDEDRIVVTGPDSLKPAAYHLGPYISEFLGKEYMVDGGDKVDTPVEMICTSCRSGDFESRSNEYCYGTKQLRCIVITQNDDGFPDLFTVRNTLRHQPGSLKPVFQAAVVEVKVVDIKTLSRISIAKADPGTESGVAAAPGLGIDHIGCRRKEKEALLHEFETIAAEEYWLGRRIDTGISDSSHRVFRKMPDYPVDLNILFIPVTSGECLHLLKTDYIRGPFTKSFQHSFPSLYPIETLLPDRNIVDVERSDNELLPLLSISGTAEDEPAQYQKKDSGNRFSDISCLFHSSKIYRIVSRGQLTATAPDICSISSIRCICSLWKLL